ncbi:citrate lyase ACP [Aminobacterium mobile]
MIAAKGTSGTDEKCDCIVSIEPSQSILLDYQGTNALLYSKRTKEIVSGTLQKYDVKAAKITIQDNGALALVIRARLESAIEMALKGSKS